MKISGICGRLLCCLAYETEQYREMKGKLPRIGQQVSTHLGKGKVAALNPLKETVMVELETETTAEISISELSIEDKTKARKKT